MNLAVISLSNEGSRIAAKLAVSWEACDVFHHAGVTELPDAKRFDRLAQLSQEVFPLYQGLVYIAPIGAVVRAIAPVSATKRSIRRSWPSTWAGAGP